MSLNTEMMQIQLLFCQYGWSAENIATTLGQPETYVQMVIADNNWSQPAALVDAATDGSAMAIQQLKATDYQKQLSMAPIAAVTELALMVKINVLATELDPEADKAHEVLNSLVKSFKMLNQDTVYNKNTDAAQTNNGVQVQVNAFME